MEKVWSIALMALMSFGIAKAQDNSYPEYEEYANYPAYDDYEQMRLYSEDKLVGQSGIVNLPTGNFYLNVPQGYLFLNAQNTRHLLVDYWGNPEERLNGVLGTLVKENDEVYYNVETAYVVSYDPAGYVSDKDASSINYSDLLKEMQKIVKEESDQNPSGTKWELLGWGWQPSYDKDKKVLAWSKHYRITEPGGIQSEVLNYDVRILGKEGFVVITAVASPEAKAELLAANNFIINSVDFKPGYTYADFNPKTDHVAEWTIGGLIAGKVLAKAGVWAVLAKFSKIIILAVIGFFAMMWKKIVGLFKNGRNGGSDEDEPTLEID
ncbi:MAG: DUF2167 domain-containing protein [Muribaculaceae bacterium]|nr:DUF2167 domain-containing protein [Muribaculaceae bacterium]